MTMSDPERDLLVRRHLRFGWWSLGLFLVLGAVLEGLHGFKADWYVDASSETRRPRASAWVMPNMVRKALLAVTMVMSFSSTTSGSRMVSTMLCVTCQLRLLSFKSWTVFLHLRAAPHFQCYVASTRSTVSGRNTTKVPKKVPGEK